LANIIPYPGSLYFGYFDLFAGRTGNGGAHQAVIALPVVVLQPDLSREIHAVQFMGRDVLITITLGKLAAIFYLGEINGAVFSRDDINLADPGFPVAADNLMAVSL